MGQALTEVMVEPEGPEAVEVMVATEPGATTQMEAPVEPGETQEPAAQVGTEATGATRQAGVAMLETGELERATTMVVQVAMAAMDLGRRWAMAPLAGREGMAARPLERAKADLVGRAEVEVVRSAMDRLAAMGATVAMEDTRIADQVGTEEMADRGDLAPGQRQPRETVAVEGTEASGRRSGTLGSVVRVEMDPAGYVVPWALGWSTSGNSCFTGTLSNVPRDCLCPCSNMRLQALSSRAQAGSVTKTGSTRISATRERPHRKWSPRLPNRCRSINWFQPSIRHPYGIAGAALQELPAP